MSWNPEEADGIFKQVIDRAAKDEEFRQLCLSAPSDAVKSASGKDLPEGFNLRFIDGRGISMTLVLPDLIPESGELSDADLEQVAGGGICVLSCGVSCIGTCVCIGIPTITGV